MSENHDDERKPNHHGEHHGHDHGHGHEHGHPPEHCCFLAGTRLLTPGGPRSVEELRPGDLLCTLNAGAQPLRWLGRSTVSLRFADPLRVLPIRIAKGALGGGLPERDLLLSPDHALYLDGILVQAAALVNGVSITRMDGMPATFTYYHAELAHHELLLAEGVAVESFIDNAGRWGFDNWQEHEALGPCAPIEEMACPRAKSIRQVPAAISARIAACSGAVEIKAA
jgi:hypothetical protein